MIGSGDFLQTMATTGNLALWTTVILLIIGLPVAYFLAYGDFKGKSAVEALICMPMVLPCLLKCSVYLFPNTESIIAVEPQSLL